MAVGILPPKDLGQDVPIAYVLSCKISHQVTLEISGIPTLEVACSSSLVLHMSRGAGSWRASGKRRQIAMEKGFILLLLTHSQA